MNEGDDVVWPYLVRKRPELYIGGTNTLGVMRIIRDLLDCGTGTSSATVEVRAAAVLIELTCTPPSVAPRAGSTNPFILEPCTSMLINVDTPPTLGQIERLDDSVEPPVFRRDGSLTTALAVANAMSTEFARDVARVRRHPVKVIDNATGRTVELT